MTSAERHQARYLRRKQARMDKKLEKSRTAIKSFEDTFSFKNLYKAYRKCYKNSNWKTSTQSHKMNIVVNVAKTRRDLLQGKFKSGKYYSFDIMERGKLRHVDSLSVPEKGVQKVVKEHVLVPLIQSCLIYDNGASIQGKGTNFARNRLKCNIQRFLRKHKEGYILIVDFSNYFASIDHDTVKFELVNRIHDERTLKLLFQFIDDFGDQGLGLGSEVSQTLAILLPNKLDNMIKNDLRIKSYGRYMDDLYIIHHDLEYLHHCLEEIAKICETLKINLNPHKIKFHKLSRGFNYMKMKYKVLPSGKILSKVAPKSMKRMKHKLKAFNEWITDNNENKKFTKADAFNSYMSFEGYIKTVSTYLSVESLKTFFQRMFGIHPNDKVRMKAVLAEGGL